MTQKMLDKFLEEYNRLDKKYDRFWDKRDEAEKNGDTEKAKARDKKMDEIAERMDGMLEALMIFGYTVRNYNGENYIVER